MDIGEADRYLVLICSLFTDIGGKLKTGSARRTGKIFPAPRLLKLTPLRVIVNSHKDIE